MINPFKEINWKPDGRELKKFAWSLIIGFPVIATLLFIIVWIAKGSTPAPTFFLLLGGIGSAVGLLSLVAPPIARPFYMVWYAIAGCIGIVMANLLFMILYYVLFTGIGLFMRLFGRDALNLKKQKEATTYWKDAPPTRPATQYFRQY